MECNSKFDILNFIHHHLHRLLVEVVDWCASRLAKLICCLTILMASSPGSLLICHSLATRLRVLHPLPSGRERSGGYTWTLMGALTHWVCFLSFLRELLMVWPPVLV